MMAHYSNPPQLTIELHDHGMIVYYPEVVRKMRAPSISRDPMANLLTAMMPKIVENIMGSEGEDWSEEKRAQKEMIALAMAKIEEQMNPKPKEEWHWEQKSAVVADAKDLPNIIEHARQALAKAKALQNEGKHIMGCPGSTVSAFSSYLDPSFAAMPSVPPVITPPPIVSDEAV
jgi:hypothetical protein